MTRFPCIVVDYPWQFDDKLPGPKRGAAKHYNVVAHRDHDQVFVDYWSIVRAQDNACMFFWRVSSMQDEALELVRALGFKVKSELVWEKKTKSGKDHFGMGRYVRMSHEVCLVCTRGSVTVLNHSTRSRFAAQVGQHSQKPDEFYRIVEQLVPGPRLELFARRRRDGWTCFGDELADEAPKRSRCIRSETWP